mmetsp:Transcript_43606/g.79457  ORF Transcript_43606/g.79457 Transcript_43606/m.79457 type:complete len:230 (-) Transcript_43606:204-893(-)
MHFRRLVGLLPPHLFDALPPCRGHTKVNDFDMKQAIATVRQQNILQGQVTMGNTQVVQPPHRFHDLPGNGPKFSLILLARLLVFVAPCEQVSLGRERNSHIRKSSVTENVVQLTGIRKFQSVQVPDDANVKPRSFCSSWILLCKLFRASCNPPVRHLLHSYHAATIKSLHQINTTVVSNGILKQLHKLQVCSLPGLDINRLLQCRIQHVHRHLCSFILLWWGNRIGVRR